MTTPLPKIMNFRARASGTLRGHFDVEMPSGMVLHDCALFVAAKGPGVAPPSRPMVGKDGMALTDANGKRKYEPSITFSDRPTQQRWSDTVVVALQAQFPEAFQ